MEKVKTNRRIVLGMFSALLFVFAFVLSACGGEPIERQDAFDAINRALSTEVVDAVGDYEVTMTMTTKENSNSMHGNLKQTSTLRYDGDSNVAYQKDNVKLTIKSSGATQLDSSSNGSSEYYIGEIEGTTYQVNSKHKAYSQYGIGVDQLTYQSTMASVSLPNEDLLQLEDDAVKLDLVKNSENSYDLTFEFTQITQQASETLKEEKTISIFVYKIRDGKISEYTTTTKEYVDGEVESEQEWSFKFKYNDVTLDMPVTTLEELDGYTEQDFSVDIS